MGATARRVREGGRAGAGMVRSGVRQHLALAAALAAGLVLAAAALLFALARSGPG